jgi:hypothetical protein
MRPARRLLAPLKVAYLHLCFFVGAQRSCGGLITLRRFAGFDLDFRSEGVVTSDLLRSAQEIQGFA